MASAVLPEKRTRSQLTIPDDLLLQLSQGSPLKDARTAMRQNTNSASNFNEEIVEETDDELLLSPGKPIETMRTTKRSVSPPPGDEYALRPQSPSEGRELKRTKLDDDMFPALNGHTPRTLPPRYTHARSHSQPEVGRSTKSIRSVTSDSDAQGSSDELATTGQGRAQSVPIFPTSLASGIVRIDLRNPPESPRRPRSRSPSKERELRIVTGPSITKLDTILDETDSAMNVDEIRQPSQQAIVSVNDVLPIGNGTTHVILDDPMPSPSPSPVHKKLTSLVLPIVVEPPTTPTGPSSPLSPLTPIPETPHLSKGGSETNRYIASGWAANIEEEEEESSMLPPLPVKPVLALAATMKSRLPRPSSSTNISNLVTDAAQDVPAAKTPVASSSSKPAIAAAKPSNAFTLLMANARESKGQGKSKGKGKEKAVAAKVVPLSGAAIKATNSSSVPLQKSKTIDKGKAKEVAPLKASIKSKMKPKMIPKPKPKAQLVPPVVPSPPPEFEKGLSPPLSSSFPRSPSPARSLYQTLIRPATPHDMDVMMKIDIEPSVETDVAMDITPETSALESLPPLETSNSKTSIDAPVARKESAADTLEPAPPSVPVTSLEPKAGSVSSPEPALDDAVPPIEDVVPVSGNITQTGVTSSDPSIAITSSMEITRAELPIKKRTATKLHMSKRLPSSAAPARITRSASLRRNQKVSEVPKALPTKASAKQTQKKSVPVPELENVPSGSSSKLDDEKQVDAAAILPISPIELSSPTKKSVKTPRSSFTQPTKSAMAKQVSPTKPSLSKARNSSPNKLGRSASMVSRPRTSLSRSFSSYSGLGSSLSTLSSALEKLQQRPPGRPSTSMGFNRDDPDSSIELETRSQDDSSIRPSTSSKPVSSASQPAAVSSRLVQGTLTSARTSLTGKTSIGGSRTMMRGTGTGIFRVPGNTTKMTRIFGVGGGAFADATRARAVQKASRKTSLPSVMSSPVKGAGNTDDAMDVDDDNAQVEETTNQTEAAADEQATVNAKGKGKERATEPWDSDASRRFSMASQVLSQSLASSAKASTGLGMMGPPATPKGHKMARSASSTYPSTSSGSRPESPTRTSLRIAKNASQAGSSSKVTPEASTVSRPESLNILKDCVVFVDVRNDDGDEVGAPFSEMLEVSGAKILTRVGQTCTHIVFKNGLMSTINRYRLLRDPKPLVVGIAWVVECAEQRTKVDETKFLVNLDGINFSSGNKRRRSMLPKLISHDFEHRYSSDVEGDVSMDGSTSSITFDDDLTPLEKARRRKIAAS
ncbi:hypothetical protein H0H87_004882 [Tephrocybe sp. NHM501043]|nr:hypothetical protein H0H87_004882 [Tephrocybe sp. NHM501043]